MMHRSTRRVHKDEELGKRDDDHKLAAETPWLWRRPRYRLKRILGFGLVALLTWLFVHHMPTDLGPANQRFGKFGSPPSRSTYDNGVVPNMPMGGPPQSSEDRQGDSSSSHWYNGFIRFHKLAGSLHGIVNTQGQRQVNRNIMFAASSLKSTTRLIPMACEMARWNRNYVHLVVFGRDEIPIPDITELNGVDSEQCSIYWHDARADYAEYSSDLRLEVSSAAGLGHVNTWMHPQALIMDDSTNEDVPFVKGISGKAKELELPIIELPSDDPERFMWMTRLDSGSLRSWHKSTIDILVHAPGDGSGSLLRLLKSLHAADYTGFSTPRLTIELSAKLDPPTQQFLNEFHWPPVRTGSPSEINQLMLHHRIDSKKASVEERSVRFLESFYPANVDTSHVLILSPQVELSPLYFHYLMYNLLRYKYPMHWAPMRQNLLGISLDLPSTHLNRTTPFTAPLGSTPDTEDSMTSFLWQAPNSNAALYFGDKWIELHSFLGYRLAADKNQRRPAQRPKLISEAHPSWTEYFLELMRSRGYSMLYPTAPAKRSAFVTVHDDLYQAPEEFEAPVTKREHDSSPPANSSEHEPFIADPLTHFKTPHNPEGSLAQSPLHRLLPLSADLPELPKLPLLSFDGNPLSLKQSMAAVESQAHRFRIEVGGCSPELLEEELAQRGRRIQKNDARDLFCFEDDYESGVLEWDHLGVEDEKELQAEAWLEDGNVLRTPEKSIAREEDTISMTVEGVVTATGLAQVASDDSSTAALEDVT